MPPPLSISLPSFSIQDKYEKTIIASEGRLEIGLPDSYGHVESIAELEHLVRSSNLWIARRGLCHLIVDLCIDAAPISDIDLLQHMEGVIVGCDVWEQLELRVVSVTEHRDKRSNRRMYSIQHPDLSSALVPPNAAPVAIFRSVSYRIDIFTRQRSEDPAKKRTLRTGSKPSKAQKRNTKTQAGRIRHEQDEYSSLVPTDRDAVDKFLAGMNMNLDANLSSAAIKKELKTDDIADLARSSHVQILVYTWLESVLCGKRHISKSVNFKTSNWAPPLSHLAPGVFDVPYLRNLARKKEFISTISSSLARMVDAESPSLRKKVEELGSCDEGNRPLNGRQQFAQIQTRIELRVWSILTSGPSQQKKGAKTRALTR